MTDESLQSLAPGTSLGRYTLKSKLGEGGMGAVYEAVHADLGKRVAIKVLHPKYASSAQVQQRFVREGQAASRIRHSNVVDVYDTAIQGETPFLVMEFLEGEDLAALIAREGALGVTRAADIMIPVLGALSAAHDLAIVHRDLKPENIFLSRDQGGTRPKVLDFGISKILDDHGGAKLTATSALLGTPYYMSPEQAAAEKDLDARSDQYSLGVILYECVTGKRPFEAPNLYAVLSAIIAGKFQHPRAIVPELPGRLDAIIVRAMSAEPKDRFTDVREMGRALLEFASEKTKLLHADELEGPQTAGPSPPPARAAAALDATAPASDAGRRDTTLGRSTAEMGPGPAPAAPRRWTVPAAAVVSLLAAGGWLATRSGEPANTANSAPEAASVAPPSATASIRTPPQVIRKTLASDPPGADVVIDGKRVGATPYIVEFPVGVSEVRATLQLAGHVSALRVVVPADPDDVSVVLAPLPAPAPPAAHRAPAGGGARPPALPKLAPR